MEQIGLLVLAALFGLVQLIVRWLRRRAPAPPPRAAEEAAVVRVRVPAPHPAPVPIVRLRPAPIEVVVARPRRHHPTVGTRADLRKAIVLREILGPCRAMERNER